MDGIQQTYNLNGLKRSLIKQVAIEDHPTAIVIYLVKASLNTAERLATQQVAELLGIDYSQLFLLLSHPTSFVEQYLVDMGAAHEDKRTSTPGTITDEMENNDFVGRCDKNSVEFIARPASSTLEFNPSNQMEDEVDGQYAVRESPDDKHIRQQTIEIIRKSAINPTWDFSRVRLRNTRAMSQVHLQPLPALVRRRSYSLSWSHSASDIPFPL